MALGAITHKRSTPELFVAANCKLAAWPLDATVFGATDTHKICQGTLWLTQFKSFKFKPNCHVCDDRLMDDGVASLSTAPKFFTVLILSIHHRRRKPQTRAHNNKDRRRKKDDATTRGELPTIDSPSCSIIFFREQQTALLVSRERSC